MRIRALNFIVIVILCVMLSPVGSAVSFYGDSEVVNDNPEILSVDEYESNLTWTSRTQQIPQNIENDSIVAGDHIIVNGTFSQSLNVTECELTIWNGFTFTSTRPVIPASDPVESFEDSIIYDDFDWVVVTGIEQGLTVNVTCNFTSTNCDFMAWPGSMDPSLYSYSKNIVEMASDDRPETDSFIWEFTNDTMFLGCLNTANDTTGNWTAIVQIGDNSTTSSSGSSIALDTYYLADRNQTYSIRVVGTTDTSDILVLRRDNVTLCNFFNPVLVVNNVVKLNDEFTNISWSCTDLNQDDVNYFEIWISRDSGVTYLYLAGNFTQSTVIWNFRGWLSGEYLIRIRAFSVDVTSEKCRFDDPPSSYWPGDYSEGFTPQFEHTGFSYPHHLYVSSVDDVTYEYGSQGNTINLTYYSSMFHPLYVDYSVRDNGSIWTDGRISPSIDVQTLTIDIDGLSVGIHQIEIEFNISEPVIVNFTINVTSNAVQSTLIPLIALSITVGAIGGIAVIVIFAIYMKTKKKG